MKMDKYKELIEKANSLDELYRIEDAILSDSDLTDGDRRVLLHIHLIPKIKQFAKGVDYYRLKIEPILEELRDYLDEEMYAVVRTYLTRECPRHYTSMETLIKRIAVYIPEFLKYVYRMKRSKVTVDDFDVRTREKRFVVTGYIIDEFAESLTDKPKLQYLITRYINTFMKYLEKRFPYISAPKSTMEKPKVAKRELPTYMVEDIKKMEKRDVLLTIKKHTKGIPRNKEELDKIFPALDSAIARSKDPIRRKTGRVYFRLLLCCGLRPEHLLVLRYEDLRTAGWYEDVWDRPFATVDIDYAMRRERERMGLNAPKTKEVPKFIHIPKDYYEQLLEVQEEFGLDDEDLIFTIPHSTQKGYIETVRKMTGITDFSRYDFRETWTSVVYNATGYNAKITMEMGGWRTTQIPFTVYIAVMSPQEAVSIAKSYKIFIPKVVADAVERIEKNMYITPDIMAKLEKLAWLEKKFEELRKKLGL